MLRNTLFIASIALIDEWNFPEKKMKKEREMKPLLNSREDYDSALVHHVRALFPNFTLWSYRVRFATFYSNSRIYANDLAYQALLVPCPYHRWRGSHHIHVFRPAKGVVKSAVVTVLSSFRWAGAPCRKDGSRRVGASVRRYDNSNLPLPIPIRTGLRQNKKETALFIQSDLSSILVLFFSFFWQSSGRFLLFLCSMSLLIGVAWFSVVACRPWSNCLQF